MPPKNKKINSVDNAAYGLALTILLIVLALFIGAMCTIWQESIVQQAEQRNTLNSRVLEARIEALEAHFNTTVTSSTVVTTSTCSIVRVTESATSTTKYTDQTLGFSVNVPYRSDWDTSPVQEDLPGSFYSFGPVLDDSVNFGSCRWVRRYVLNKIPPRSASTVQSFPDYWGLMASSHPVAPTDTTIKRVLPNLIYVKNTDPQHPIVEIIRPEANYVLSVKTGLVPTADDLAILERVAQSFRFTK